MQEMAGFYYYYCPKKKKSTLTRSPYLKQTTPVPDARHDASKRTAQTSTLNANKQENDNMCTKQHSDDDDYPNPQQPHLSGQPTPAHADNQYSQYYAESSFYANSTYSAVYSRAYLLEVDEVCILLYWDWTDEYDVELLKPLQRVLGLNAPVYGMRPMHRMGQIPLYGAFQAMTKLNSDFSLFSPDDLDVVFEHFMQLKYLDKFTLTSGGEGIVITPNVSGHLGPGGAL
ncbi:hypothetical protein PHYSODRAFT_347174 [Phytophthora sojae]|uniref:Cleavage and polyadenylation specificity factor subunit 2 n=1 Tax=Phytophthora sojae (strain P6497) TaxID=1094619 RepID=G4ZSJ3_PHYSP|nr:hypothetical protein PHYSODRAFT_347174 [Phytophthora sojae]EGZ14215.1 hypothetical protein PHYSODRAFT_347174 [Phytophthora sojae]|eukprot:XP_009531644.1 hypothetical protein PHYSODRAFT_347174 [Phytophthora sojae]